MSKIISTIWSIAKKYPNKIAISSVNIEDKKIIKKNISYSLLVKMIDETSKKLQKLNYQKIALVADNSSKWVIFDLACLKAGIVFIPLPHFFTEEQITKIIKYEGLKLKNFDDNFFKFASKIYVSNRRGYDLEVCKVTFTSGSTKEPKPVAITSNNIDLVTFSLQEVIGKNNLKKFLSILPLTILLENLAGVYLPLICGSTSTIASLEIIGITNSSGINFDKFILAFNIFKPNNFILSPELAKLLIHLIKRKLVNSKNFKFIAVGGAKISKDLLDEAHALKIPLYQGYGLSECCSVVCLNTILENKNGSVGKILPHIKIKISKDREILIKSKSIAKGLKLDKNGYYHTGDLGYFDCDNFLFIDGRKKNMFITSMMRNVNPEWIEGEFLKSDLISQIAVFGEAMPYNVSIIMPASNKISEKEIQNLIDKINPTLPDYARIKKFIFAHESFNTTNKMLTGNGRIKRDKIWGNYKKFFR